HAKGFIEQNLEFKFSTSQEATDWLNARLAEQRKQVEDTEAALQRYREQNQAIPPEDTTNIVVKKLEQLNQAVTAAKTKRLEQEALYQQLLSVQNDPANLDAFPAVLSNQYIQQQRSELSILMREEGRLAQTFGRANQNLIEVRAAIQTTKAKLQ